MILQNKLNEMCSQGAFSSQYKNLFYKDIWLNSQIITELALCCINMITFLVNSSIMNAWQHLHLCHNSIRWHGNMFAYKGNHGSICLIAVQNTLHRRPYLNKIYIWPLFVCLHGKYVPHHVFHHRNRTLATISLDIWNYTKAWCQGTECPWKSNHEDKTSLWIL